MKLFILAAGLALGLASTAMAETVRGDDNLLAVDLGADPASLPLGEFTELPFTLMGAGNTPVAGAVIAVSGGMPGHGHGLPTKPVVEEIGGGKYVIKGLKFSMGGDWRLILDIRADTVTDRMSFDFGL